MSRVSILVLMDLCIKTEIEHLQGQAEKCFNPCFNGSMYKNTKKQENINGGSNGFNPCFNGSMYKNEPGRYFATVIEWFQSLF